MYTGPCVRLEVDPLHHHPWPCAVDVVDNSSAVPFLRAREQAPGSHSRMAHGLSIWDEAAGQKSSSDLLSEVQVQVVRRFGPAPGMCPVVMATIIFLSGLETGGTVLAVVKKVGGGGRSHRGRQIIYRVFIRFFVPLPVCSKRQDAPTGCSAL